MNWKRRPLMKTVSIQENQTLLDVALQYYGSAEAISDILQHNPGLKNPASALVKEGRPLGRLYPDIKLEPGFRLRIDDDSRLQKKTVVKKITNDVTTYMTKEWQERLNK